MNKAMSRAVCVLALAAGGQVFAQTALTPREIASQTRDSVVNVTTYVDGEEYAFGSGFVFRSDGVIATNLHVAMGSDALKIELADGASFDAVSVLGFDEERDIVLLKVQAAGLHALTVGDDAAMQVGDPVYVMGNPLGLSGTFSDGLLSAKRTEDGTDLLQISAPISEGSSGGPVLNAAGEVIGIATSYYVEGQNLNMAMPARYAELMLSANEAPVPYAESAVAGLGKTGFEKLGDYVWEWPEIMAVLPAQVRSDLADKESWEQQVAARSKIASDAMIEKGWQAWGEVDWDYLATGEWNTLMTFLPAGTYRVFSICDDDCLDIDVAIYDAGEELVAEDTEIDAFPLLDFEITRAGNYAIDTTMYDCETNVCLYRTMVWAEQSSSTDVSRLDPSVHAALALIDSAVNERQDLRWLRRIERDYPIVRQQFIALISEHVDRNASESEIMTGILSWSVAVGSSYLPNYLASASDEAVEEFTLHFVGLLEQLMERRDETCYAWMIGDVSAPNTVDLLRQFDSAEMNAIIGRVIDSVGTGFIETISEEVALAFLEIVFAEMQDVDADSVEDLALMESVDLSAREQRRACEATLLLYQATLSLPETARADVLRYLYAGG